MQISMNTVTFNRCKVREQTKRVSRESHQAFGSSAVFILLLWSMWIKKTGLQSERDSQRPEGPPLMSLKVAAREARWAPLGVLQTPNPSVSLQRAPCLLPCPTEEIRPCPSLQLTQTNCSMSLSLQKTQTGRSSEESRGHTPGPRHSALFPRSTGSQTATARPKNCLHDLWTSLTPQGIWSFWLDH